jgi:26S proteasome regulatory subunit N9
VRDFESKLNQLKLVEMGTKVSKEIDSRFDPQILNDLT